MLRWILTVTFCLLAFFALLIFSKKEEIKQTVIAHLTDKLENATQCKLKISGVDFHFPLTVSIQHLELADQDQLLMSMEKCKLKISPLMLIKNQHPLDRVSIKVESATLPYLLEDSIQFKGIFTYNGEATTFEMDGTVGSSYLKGILTLDSKGHLDGSQLQVKTPVIQKKFPFGNYMLKTSLQRVTTDLSFSGTIQEPTILATIHAAIGQLNEFTLDRFSCKANLKAKNQTVEGHLECCCSTNHQEELNLCSAFSLDSQQLDCHQLTLTSPHGGECQGALQLQFEQNHLVGHLNGYVDPYLCKTLFSMPLENQVNFAALFPATTPQSLQVDLETEMPQNQRLHAVAKVIMNVSQPAAKLEWKWDSIKIGNQEFCFTGTTNIDFNQETHLCNWELKELNQRTTQLAGTCSWNCHEDLTVVMEDVHGVFNHSPLFLLHPFQISIRQDSIQHTPFTLSIAEAELTLADITFKGPFSNPEFFGKLLLKKGCFDFPYFGINLCNIELEGTFNAQELTLSSIKGKDGKNGKVEGSATIQLSNHFPFESTLFLRDFNLIFSANFKTCLNGGLSLSGSKNGCTLAGQLDASSIDVIIPEKQKEVITSVPVTYVNQPQGVSVPSGPSATYWQWPIMLELFIHIPKQISIEGKNFHSEWKGDINLTGNAEAPFYQGQCHLIKGEYSFNGTPFKLAEGTITFDGDYNKKTTVYVIASKEFDEIKAEMIFKGPLKNPMISFRSNPPLPQREILSWILFNRGTSEISPFQGTQLNESITLLQANGDQPNPLANLRQRLGIDRIEINRASPESNEVSLQVGKYISGVFFSLNKGITEEANKLGIEADLLKNVKLQAEIGDNSEGQLKLKWKKDY